MKHWIAAAALLSVSQVTWSAEPAKAEPAKKVALGVAAPVQMIALTPPKPAAAVPGPFKIGNSGPSAGANSASMLELLAGAKLYFAEVNRTGGVKGRQIELIQRDDNFEVPRTVANVQKLIETDQVHALLLVRGTPHNEAILPIIEKAGVPLIGPSTGAMTLHNPVKKYVFNVRAPYRYEAQKLAELLAVLGKHRICVIHVKDSFGADVADGFMAGLSAKNLKPIHVHTFERQSADLSAFLPLVKKAEPDAIVLIGAGKAVSEGIAAMRKMDIQAPVATVSNNASSGFIQSLGKNGHGVMVSQVFPDERLADMPLVLEARRLATSAGTALTPAMMEGFAAAKVTVEALRACRGPCARADLHQALDSLNVDLGGMRLAYSAKDHTGVEYADLSIIDRRGKFKR